jgi:hypothetical protein
MISSCLRDVGALFHVQKRSTSAAKCIGHFCIIFPLRGLDLFPSCTTFWNQEIIWYSNWKAKRGGTRILHYPVARVDAQPLRHCITFFFFSPHLHELQAPLALPAEQQPKLWFSHNFYVNFASTIRQTNGSTECVGLVGFGQCLSWLPLRVLFILPIPREAFCFPCRESGRPASASSYTLALCMQANACYKRNFQGIKSACSEL